MNPLKKYVTLIFLILLYNACSESKPKKNNKTDNNNKPKIDSVLHNKKTEKKISPDYDTLLWTEIEGSRIKLDIRYATTNNFVKKQLYDCPRCFLRPEVAKEILKINEILKDKGLKLKLFDCYRPRPIQQKLWNIKPDARYVTPPTKGSMHNRGLAIDLTIIDDTGKQLDMGTGYDYFGIKAYHTTTNLPKQVLENRKLLKSLLESHGFKAIRTEWWHYSYTQKSYPLSDWVWDCK